MASDMFPGMHRVQSLSMRPVGDVRRHNLGALVQEAGGQRKLAERLADGDPKKIAARATQVNQLLQRSKDTKSGKTREIGNEMARNLELAMGKAEGWMDVEHSPDTPTLTPSAITLAKAFDKITDPKVRNAVYAQCLLLIQGEPLPSEIDERGEETATSPAAPLTSRKPVPHR
jgi:hypothetical protein